MNPENWLRTRKYDGSPHWAHRLRDLRQPDLHENGPLFTGHLRAGDVSESPNGPIVNPSDTTVWAWTDRWYTVAHNVPPWHRGEVYYVNIGTPVEWNGADLGTVDLDLDVAVYADGSVRVLDEDEFATHRARYAYPAEVVAAAEAAVVEVLGLIREGAFPFHDMPGEDRATH
jgi:protein associated with RNAse G/E